MGDCRTIHLDIPHDLLAEKVLSADHSGRTGAILANRHGCELDRNERDRFARRRIIHSVELAVGRQLSIQTSTCFFDLRRDLNNPIDSGHDVARAHAAARHQRRR